MILCLLITAISTCIKACRPSWILCTLSINLIVFKESMDSTANLEMPQMSLYVRLRLFALICSKKKVSKILDTLQKEGIKICRQTVWRFLAHVRKHKTVAALQRPGRPSKPYKLLKTVCRIMMKQQASSLKQC